VNIYIYPLIAIDTIYIMCC